MPVRNGSRPVSPAPAAVRANGHLANRATIRPATGADVGFLRRMTYEAAFWRPGRPRPHFERSLARSDISRYIRDWGRDGDEAVIAVVKGRPVGAAWFRLFEPDDAGYGFVAPDVPELAIAVEKPFRGRGIGGRLLHELLARAAEQGYPLISLSVCPDNPAVGLYRAFGFRVVGSDECCSTMVVELQPRC